MMQWCTEKITYHFYVCGLFIESLSTFKNILQQNKEHLKNICEVS